MKLQKFILIFFTLTSFACSSEDENITANIIELEITTVNNISQSDADVIVKVKNKGTGNRITVSYVLDENDFGNGNLASSKDISSDGEYIINLTRLEHNKTYYIKVALYEYGNNTLRIIKRNNEIVSFASKPLIGTGAINNLVSVEGGSFTMGCNDCGENNQSPEHQVTLSSFKIGKYEITNNEFADFLNNQTYKNSSWIYNTGNEQIKLINNVFVVDSGKENYPAVEITWAGATAYAEWVGGRLPTEAEWEFSAKGGNLSDGYTYSGSDDLNEVAWFTDNSNNTTHSVGLRFPNELDIYDMSGNAWEWCQDELRNYDSSIPIKNHHIIRGGNFENESNYCSNTFRVSGEGVYSDFSNNYTGFRVVVEN